MRPKQIDRAAARIYPGVCRSSVEDAIWPGITQQKSGSTAAFLFQLHDWMRMQMSSASAPPLGCRLIGQLGVVAAIGTMFAGLRAAEAEIFRKRVAVWPFAGALRQFDQLEIA